MDSPSLSFRERLRSGAPLLGTFLKTPTVHATEILAGLGFDFVVIDQEHAPFGETVTDCILLAARACGIAALVRVRAACAADVQRALDDGAQGIVVPHVSSAAIARSMGAAARYRGGTRGFSNSPRAGRYGASGVWEHVDACDALTTVVAMIEDLDALAAVDEIAAIDSIDALFIGRGDLTVALGAAAPDAPEVREAVERIAAAGRAHGKALCAHSGRIDPAEIDWLTSLGIRATVVSSDQGLMRAAAGAAVADFRRAVSPASG